MSELKANKISPATLTDVVLGDSGDTFTIPSGATIVNSGTATGFGGGVDGITSSANTTAISISADEEVNMPLQPCFLLGLSVTVANIIGDGSGYQLPFDNEIFDVGGNCTTTTFTAPITGRYLLILNIGLDSINGSTADYYSVNIVTSNRTYGTWNYDTNFPDNARQDNVSAVCDMDAGDTATTNIVLAMGSLSGNISAGLTCYFSGMLLA